MADNTVLNAGAGGDTIASDDIAGIKHQRVKLSVGADGAASDAIPVSNGLDTTAAGVPAVGLVAQLDDTATGAVTENQFAPVRLSSRRALLVEGVASGTEVPISAASLPLPASASTEATVSALAGDVGDTADAAATAGGTGTLHAKQRLMTSQLDSIKTAVETLDNAIAGTEMQVDVVAALPAGTNNIGDVDVLSIIPGTGATNLGKAIDTPTGATDTGVLLLATRDDALGALTPIESDNVQLRVDANGALWTHDDALDAALAGSELQVDIVGALPAGTNAIGKLSANTGVDIGDVDVLSIAAGDNNIGNVDIVTMPNVTLAAGTNTNEVVGDAAHDAAAAGNPVLVCGIAQDTDDTAPPNRVSAEADATRLATDRDGSLFSRPHGPQVWSYHANGSSALTDASVHAAPGAGLSLYVTDVVVSLGAATALNVFFEEGASTVLGPWYLEAINGRGLHIQFQTPKKITANTALTVTTSAAVAHSVDVTGFTAQG